MDIENPENLPSLSRTALNWMVEQSDSESVFEIVMTERNKWEELPERERFEVILRLLQ